MTEENENPPNNGSIPPPTPTSPVITLTITLDATGNVNVNGPVHDLILCYGLLGRAHDAIKDWNDKQRASGLVLVPPGTKLRQSPH